jgi:uncharacterized heparinase superfamily protein
VLAETPVLTSDGVKVTDAAWISAASAASSKDTIPQPCNAHQKFASRFSLHPTPPEERAEKRALYFEAGAHEVWLCAIDGKIAFCTPRAHCSICNLPRIPKRDLIITPEIKSTVY